MEKRHEVLHRFDLGHEWDSDSNNCLQKSEKILAKQETGILFLESCVKQTKPRGRIGIILPNGYLGNRSKKYTVMREWLLRECFLVSICSFTRFTFKSSGADVSASVVFLQKRDTPLKTAVDSDDYLFNVQLIQTVGWDVGKKNGKPTYKKNSLDGSYIIGNSGEKILDADFKKSLRSIRSGSAANAFTWLREGHDIEHDSINETSFSIQHILNDADLTMDPKRHNQKFLELRQENRHDEAFQTWRCTRICSETFSWTGENIAKQSSKIYRYVEISDMDQGGFKTQELHGWDLPDRAKHFAERGGYLYRFCLGERGKVVPDRERRS